MLDKKSFYKLLKKLPKAELHLHSEGIVSRKTVQKLLSRNDQKYNDPENIEQLFSYHSLEEFIQVFLKIQKSFQKESDFELLFIDILTYLLRNNIIYAELYFSPSFFIANGWQYDRMLDIILEKIRMIRKKTNIDIKIIIDVSRTFGLKNARTNYENLLHYIDKTEAAELIGIGLGGDEVKGPANQFGEIFEHARQKKINRVAHAGEVVGSQSIWDALQLLHVQRIGHGISAVFDAKLIDYLVQSQIPLEICPTSNIFTQKYVSQIEKHPVKELFEKGVFITINTDDPTYFSVELVDEYWNLYSKLGFTIDQIKTLLLNSFKAAFLPPAQKKQLMQKFHDTWNSLKK